MAKNAITDYSQTASANTDIGDISLLGTASPRVIKDYMPELMSQLADMNAGTSPLNDTFAIRDATDTTKKGRWDVGEVPTATFREPSLEKAYQLIQQYTDLIDVAARRGAPTVTTYTASGTHTFAANTNYFMIIAIGAGGGSGAVDGQGTGTGGCSAGGNSGFHGRTAILAKGALTTGTVVIGAAGTAGAAPSDAGGDGGDTTWTDATNGTLTWQGGKGSSAVTATGTRAFGLPLANDASTASLLGTYELGGAGITNGTAVAGGLGASSPWGTGGISTLAFDTSVTGVAGSGYGAGGAGAGVHGVGSNVSGGAGTGGRLEVWEW